VKIGTRSVISHQCSRELSREFGRIGDITCSPLVYPVIGLGSSWLFELLSHFHPNFRIVVTSFHKSTFPHCFTVKQLFQCLSYLFDCRLMASMSRLI
jgi:hypothetical protein